MAFSGLTQQIKDLNLEVSVIKNDVLFFLQKNHANSSNGVIIEVCKGHFNEDETCAAKDLLAGECIELVRDIDTEAAKNLLIQRRGSNITCKLDSVLSDIMKVIDCLEACESEVKIIAMNEERIPNFNSESASLKAIMQTLKDFEKRLEKAEVKIAELKTENDKLRKDVNRSKDHVGSGIGEGSGGEGLGVGGDRLGQRTPPHPSRTSPTGTASPVAEQDIPPPPSQPPNEPPQPSGEEPNGQAIVRSKNSRLTNKQKKELNKIRLESAMNAMAEAIGSGTAPIDAISIGKTAGDEQANLWVQVV